MVQCSVILKLGKGDFITLNCCISHVVSFACPISRAVKSADLKEVTTQFIARHIFSFHCESFCFFLLEDLNGICFLSKHLMFLVKANTF